MNRRKKGISIAEICIVLAVISIAGLMVTSFTVMVGTRSKAAVDRVTVLEELEMTEKVMEGWVDYMTGQGAVFSAEEGQLEAVKDAVTYTPVLENGLLTATVPDGTPFKVALETVTAISVEAKFNGQDAIFFCTLTYTDPRGTDQPQTYTFCINSRVGETIQ